MLFHTMVQLINCGADRLILVIFLIEKFFGWCFYENYICLRSLNKNFLPIAHVAFLLGGGNKTQFKVEKFSENIRQGCATLTEGMRTRTV